MMMATVGDLLALLEKMAPMDTAMDWDNAGLLLGDADQPVDTVYVALDATQRSIHAAIKQGAQLLLTHHPLMFRPIQRIIAQEYEGSLLLSMAKQNLSLIALHTNWDAAAGGVNDALIETLGYTAEPIRNDAPLTRQVRLPHALPLEALCQHIGNCLGFPARCYGPADRSVSSIWIAAGAGGDLLHPALCQHVDCVLSGEWKHHEMLPFLDAGIGVIEAGHAATERPGVRALAEGLQKACHAVQYNIRVIVENHGL